MKFTILALAAALVAGKYNRCGWLTKSHQYYGEFCAAEFADAEDNCNAYGEVKKDTCADVKVCWENFKAAKEECGDDKDCYKTEKAAMRVCAKEAKAVGQETIAGDEIEEIPRRAFKKWVWKNKKTEMLALMQEWKEKREREQAAHTRGGPARVCAYARAEHESPCVE